MNEKRCQTCKATKDISCYAKSSLKKDGLQGSCTECRHRFYELNKERILQLKKQRYNENRYKFLARQKEWYHKNKESRKEYNRVYRTYNKAKLSAKQMEKQRLRRENDLSFRLIQNIRRRVAHVIKGKSSTTKYIGCNKEELRQYIESKFKAGMSWDNYGQTEKSWVIDHIIPLSSYKKDKSGNWKENSKYNQKLIHYSNMQPMWRNENRTKSNKLP